MSYGMENLKFETDNPVLQDLVERDHDSFKPHAKRRLISGAIAGILPGFIFLRRVFARRASHYTMYVLR